MAAAAADAPISDNKVSFPEMSDPHPEEYTQDPDGGTYADLRDLRDGNSAPETGERSRAPKPERSRAPPSSSGKSNGVVEPWDAPDPDVLKELKKKEEAFAALVKAEEVKDKDKRYHYTAVAKQYPVNGVSIFSGSDKPGFDGFKRIMSAFAALQIWLKSNDLEPKFHLYAEGLVADGLVAYLSFSGGAELKTLQRVEWMEVVAGMIESRVVRVREEGKAIEPNTGIAIENFALVARLLRAAVSDFRLKVGALARLAQSAMDTAAPLIDPLIRSLAPVLPKAAKDKAELEEKLNEFRDMAERATIRHTFRAVPAGVLVSSKPEDSRVVASIAFKRELFLTSRVPTESAVRDHLIREARATFQPEQPKDEFMSEKDGGPSDRELSRRVNDAVEARLARAREETAARTRKFHAAIDNCVSSVYEEIKKELASAREKLAMHPCDIRTGAAPKPAVMALADLDEALIGIALELRDQIDQARQRCGIKDAEFRQLDRVRVAPTAFDERTRTRVAASTDVQNKVLARETAIKLRAAERLHHAKKVAPVFTKTHKKTAGGGGADEEESKQRDVPEADRVPQRTDRNVNDEVLEEEFGGGNVLDAPQPDEVADRADEADDNGTPVAVGDDEAE